MRFVQQFRNTVLHSPAAAREMGSGLANKRIGVGGPDFSHAAWAFTARLKKGQQPISQLTFRDFGGTMVAPIHNQILISVNLGFQVHEDRIPIHDPFLKFVRFPNLNVASAQILLQKEEMRFRFVPRSWHGKFWRTLKLRSLLSSPLRQMAHGVFNHGSINCG